MSNIHNKIAVAGFFTVTIGVLGIFAVVPYILNHSPQVVTSVSQGEVRGEQVVFIEEPLILFPSLKQEQTFSPLEQSRINATSVFVLDTKTNDVLFEKNSEIEHTIASLTKLISAGMLIERGLQDSEASVDGNTVRDAIDQYNIPLDKNEAVSRLKLPFRESFSSKDLLQASLVGSANDAMFALVSSQGLDEVTFKAEMDEFLVRHNASHTKIFEPSGLNWLNVSTAREFAELARISLSFIDIRTITQQVETSITSIGTHNTYTISTTNDLLESTDYIVGGKTGFLDASGYTFALLAKHKSKREVMIVLFGSTSKQARIDDARTIMNWLNDNYTSN